MEWLGGGGGAAFCWHRSAAPSRACPMAAGNSQQPRLWSTSPVATRQCHHRPPASSSVASSRLRVSRSQRWLPDLRPRTAFRITATTLDGKTPLSVAIGNDTVMYVGLIPVTVGCPVGKLGRSPDRWLPASPAVTNPQASISWWLNADRRERAVMFVRCSRAMLDRLDEWRVDREFASFAGKRASDTGSRYGARRQFQQLCPALGQTLAYFWQRGPVRAVVPNRARRRSR